MRTQAQKSVTALSNRIGNGQIALPARRQAIIGRAASARTRSVRFLAHARSSGTTLRTVASQNASGGFDCSQPCHSPCTGKIVTRRPRAALMSMTRLARASYLIDQIGCRRNLSGARRAGFEPEATLQVSSDGASMSCIAVIR